jgi:hypothetical protein
MRAAARGTWLGYKQQATAMNIIIVRTKSASVESFEIFTSSRHLARQNSLVPPPPGRAEFRGLSQRKKRGVKEFVNDVFHHQPIPY